jgi:hypothetical protein
MVFRVNNGDPIKLKVRLFYLKMKPDYTLVWLEAFTVFYSCLYTYIERHTMAPVTSQAGRNVVRVVFIALVLDLLGTLGRIPGDIS